MLIISPDIQSRVFLGLPSENGTPEYSLGVNSKIMKTSLLLYHISIATRPSLIFQLCPAHNSCFFILWSSLMILRGYHTLHPVKHHIFFFLTLETLCFDHVLLENWLLGVLMNSVHLCGGSVSIHDWKCTYFTPFFSFWLVVSLIL